MDNKVDFNVSVMRFGEPLVFVDYGAQECAKLTIGEAENLMAELKIAISFCRGMNDNL